MKPVPEPDPKLAIGLVLYFPDDRLMERIALIEAFGCPLFIFDNSPDDGKDRNAFFGRGRHVYISGGNNMGLGFSLKVICATAYAHGFERLLFLDQDTRISDRTLTHINSFSLAADRELQESYALVVFSGNAHQSAGVVETSLAISSGSLFMLRSLQKIGWHNEKYFVDCVDYELCLRARRLGFKVGVFYNTPDFDHVSEQPDRVILVLGKRLLVRRYSAGRIRDAVKGYLRLIGRSVAGLRFADAAVVCKSFSIYCFGQVVSRVIATKPKQSSSAKA